MSKSATAIWQGSGKEGNGNLSTESKALNKVQYSWKSRFADGDGTNPEELIAAAHAGCFSMKLSFVLGEAGFTAEHIETTASVTLENGSITGSHLVLKAKVPGISEVVFQKCAADAKANCPVSKVLNTQITLEAKLLEIV
jgi:osmotically inducible protein OsmC